MSIKKNSRDFYKAPFLHHITRQLSMNAWRSS